VMSGDTVTPSVSRLLGQSSGLSETYGAECLGHQSSRAVRSSAVSD